LRCAAGRLAADPENGAGPVGVISLSGVSAKATAPKVTRSQNRTYLGARSAPKRSATFDESCDGDRAVVNGERMRSDPHRRVIGEAQPRRSRMRIGGVRVDGFANVADQCGIIVPPIAFVQSARTFDPSKPSFFVGWAVVVAMAIECGGLGAEAAIGADAGGGESIIHVHDLQGKDWVIRRVNAKPLVKMGNDLMRFMGGIGVFEPSGEFADVNAGARNQAI